MDVENTNDLNLAVNSYPKLPPTSSPIENFYAALSLDGNDKNNDITVVMSNKSTKKRILTIIQQEQHYLHGQVITEANNQEVKRYILQEPRIYCS